MQISNYSGTHLLNRVLGKVNINFIEVHRFHMSCRKCCNAESLKEALKKTNVMPQGLDTQPHLIPRCGLGRIDAGDTLQLLQYIFNEMQHT